MDDDSTAARLAYRTAETQKQTARLTLVASVIGLAVAAIKTIINSV